MLPNNSTDNTVNAAVIAPLVHDFLMKLANGNDTVWTTPVFGKNPNRRRFHRQACRYKDPSAIQTDVRSAELEGVKPCWYCISDVRTTWAHKLGFPRGFIDDLTAGRITRLSNDYAMRLLKGIGEPPHPALIKAFKQQQRAS